MISAKLTSKLHRKEIFEAQGLKKVNELEIWLIVLLWEISIKNFYHAVMFWTIKSERSLTSKEGKRKEEADQTSQNFVSSYVGWFSWNIFLFWGFFFNCFFICLNYFEVCVATLVITFFFFPHCTGSDWDGLNFLKGSNRVLRFKFVTKQGLINSPMF